MLILMSILKWIAIISFGYFILRNLKHWILWILGQLVLWGWLFPKTMRKELDTRTLEAQRTNRHIDLLTQKIENAQSVEEIEILYQRIKNINA